ncbi:hypothetical protein JK156_22725 [Enterobacter ludwigii]|uniref:hypothetical protein n=1 Tax=Enterobacter cloacae complex TaxID=354276 RepID=UPI00079CD2D5|nr:MULTISPECIES: hypothetical protein [Enterobacter cloacae complex]MCU3671649.1 hypothetical protein [Enterobacter hormaechei subsp. oharae]DAH96781.1 MAG TPA: PliG inhibitor, g-type lysozyme binding.02A [Caudoviricetes sp.]HCJ7383519.1 hypothetical protein [Enterobacter hormaechei subsp. xiangfangensis]ELC6495946.1 hypothetical protein [Enterobacter hormaechei]MBK4608058.1 hypothetical protein [Enterobacter hormaechei]
MSKVVIDLLVMDDFSDPFICGVRGACTIEDLQAIEKEIIENRDERLPKDGTYTIETSLFKGQYGEYGRCELAPGWEWEIVEFSPLEIPEE